MTFTGVHQQQLQTQNLTHLQQALACLSAPAADRLLDAATLFHPAMTRLQHHPIAAHHNSDFTGDTKYVGIEKTCWYICMISGRFTREQIRACKDRHSAASCTFDGTHLADAGGSLGFLRLLILEQLTLVAVHQLVTIQEVTTIWNTTNQWTAFSFSIHHNIRKY